jgi:hypothetical protein
MKHDTKEVKRKPEAVTIRLLTKDEAFETLGRAMTQGERIYFIDWLYSHGYVIGRKG